MLVKDRIDKTFSDRTVDADEIARFEALAEEWWNPRGKFRVIHAFNETRRKYIEDRIAQKFQCGSAERPYLSNISILDVGCGGGLICEPLASQGANVVGVDATSRNIEIATRHAQQSGINVDYRHGTAETALNFDEKFDVVLNLEVIEHVADSKKLMADCTLRLKPGGLLIVATLNRTWRSLALAIIGAEYILRWLPVGTHNWNRFLKPSEVKAMLVGDNLKIEDTVGVALNPLNRKWKITSSPSVNYMVVAEKLTTATH